MLLRHDYVTLYANGIRYLEKAPLFYWLMALAMKLFGATTSASQTAAGAHHRRPGAAARKLLAAGVSGLCVRGCTRG